MYINLTLKHIGKQNRFIGSHIKPKYVIWGEYDIAWGNWNFIEVSVTLAIKRDNEVSSSKSKKCKSRSK